MGPLPPTHAMEPHAPSPSRHRHTRARTHADVLLGAPPPSVLLSERPLRAVMQQYEHQGGGVRALMDAWQAAHVRHHAQQPLASLAPAALGISLVSPANEAWEEGPSKTPAKAPGKASKISAKTPVSKTNEKGHEVVELSSDDESEDESEGEEGAGRKKGGKDAAGKQAAETLEHAIARLPASVVLSAAAAITAGAQPQAGGAKPQALQGEKRPTSSKGAASSQTASKPGKATAASLAEARGVVEDAVREAADALARWRLGVLWAAKVGGHACASACVRVWVLRKAKQGRQRTRSRGGGWDVL